MSQIPEESKSSMNAEPLPKYRGWSGAVLYGVFLASIILGFAVIAGGLVWLQRRDWDAVWPLAGRLGLLAGVCGLTAALCRGIAGAATNSFTSMRFERGDFGSITCLIGLVLAGYASERLQLQPKGADGDHAVGQIVELSGPTLDGGQWNLAQHRGKVVLIDFWATWCGPCVAELPLVEAIYEKYHGQGFEVVGVSLDFQKAALERFLKDKKHPWPQIFFDDPEKVGFDHPLARQWNLQGIPFLLLVDREGRLLAKNLRGDQITRSVTEAMGGTLEASDHLLSFVNQLIRWLMQGIIESPAWLLFVCAVGGGLLGMMLEVALRRLFSRSPAAAASV